MVLLVTLGFALGCSEFIMLGVEPDAASALGVPLSAAGDLVEPRRQVGVISRVYSGFSIASVLGVPAGTLLCELLGWHVAFLVVFALGLAVSLALVAVLPRSGSTDEPATVAQQLAILRDVPVLLNIALVLFGAAGTYVFYTYIAAFLESVLGLTAAAASAFLTTVGVATIISNLSSGVIASRFGMESLAAGDKVALRGPAGQPTPATVVRVTPSKIMVDADHELAGKALSFEIELVEAEGWS